MSVRAAAVLALLAVCACDGSKDPLAGGDTSVGVHFSYSGATSGDFSGVGEPSVYTPPGWDPPFETRGSASHDTTSGMLAVVGQKTAGSSTVNQLMILLLHLPKGSAVAAGDYSVCAATTTTPCALIELSLGYVLNTSTATGYYEMTAGTVRIATADAAHVTGSFFASGVGKALPGKAATGTTLNMQQGAFNVTVMNAGLRLGGPGFKM